MVSKLEQGAFAGRRVLVVEDEYILADDIGRALGQLGADVIGPVGTVEAAMAVLEKDRAVDAVVLDINLRAQPSFSIADELLARGIPFVFATGYDAVVIPASYSHVGHWVKPFDPNALVRALRDLIPGPA